MGGVTSPGVPVSPTLVLASSSPRRRELLSGLGLVLEVLPAMVDETPLPGEEASELVARLSVAKASVVTAKRPDALVIAADTAVVVGGEILGKPSGLEQNAEFLRRLSGTTHTVLTGHCLRRGPRTASRVERTDVTFRALDPDEIDRYVATGEGLDKAGGYGIQGRGAALVPHVEGCYFNVVGLSLATVVELARELGVVLV